MQPEPDDTIVNVDWQKPVHRQQKRFVRGLRTLPPGDLLCLEDIFDGMAGEARNYSESLSAIGRSASDDNPLDSQSGCRDSLNASS